MIYSPNKKWYFVHVPKNAGSAILRPFCRLGKQVGGNDEYSQDELTANRKKCGYVVYNRNGNLNHNKASHWYNHTELKDLTAVGILRNPWARCLSIYLFSVSASARCLNEEWARIDHPILIKQGFKRAWMPGGFFVDSHAKEWEYCEATGRAWSYEDDQYSWLEGVPRSMWFKMETQMKEFCRFVGMEEPERHNTTSKTDYRNYYDNELAQRISELFPRDITLGGYRF